MQFHTNRISGAKVLIFAWTVWGICYFVSPTNPQFFGTPATLALFVGANVTLLAGLTAPIFPRPDPTARRRPLSAGLVTWLEKVVLALVGMGLLALVTRTIDYFVFRGLSLGDTFGEAREALSAAGPNAVSGVSALLAPAGMAAGILALPLLAQGRKSRTVYAGVALFLLTPISSFASGSRSALLMTMTALGITLLLVLPKLTRRLLALALLAAGGAFALSMHFFISRLEETLYPLEFFALNSGYTELVPPTPEAIDLIRTLNPPLDQLYFYVLSILQYATHGVFEFFLLLDIKAGAPVSDPLQWGRFQFIIVDQILKVVSPPNEVVDLGELNPRTGLFSTFWGPAYFDFGTWLPLYGFAFGFVGNFFQSRVRRGDVYALPLYGLLLYQIALVPMVNLVESSALYYFLFLFFLWLLMSTLSSNRPYLAINGKYAPSCQIFPSALQGSPPIKPRSESCAAPIPSEKENNSMLQKIEDSPPTQENNRLQDLSAAIWATRAVPLIAGIVGIICIIGLISFLRLTIPATTTYSARIQFTFPEAAQGKYPNDSPFSINEVIDPNVLSSIYADHNLAQYGISPSAFYTAISVRPFSPTEAESVERARQQLSDRRLTLTERERVEAQLRAQLDLASKGAAEITWSLQERLPLPREVGLAVMQSVPLAWSKFAMTQKGVLHLLANYFAADSSVNQEVIKSMPTPLAIVTTLHATDRLRGRFRVLSALPGFKTRVDPISGKSFRDVDAEFRDFVLFQLNPIYAALGEYDFGGERSQVEVMVERHIHETELRAAFFRSRADALAEAIKQFVEAVGTLKGRQADRRGNFNEPPAAGISTIPQLSEGFIDKIIDLARKDREQESLRITEMTQRHLAVVEEMVEINAEANWWRDLLGLIKKPSSNGKSLDETTRTRLDASVAIAAQELNSIWKTLNRLQDNTTNSRGDTSGRLYVPYSFEANTTHPAYRRWLLASLLGLVLTAALAAWAGSAFKCMRKRKPPREVS